MLEVHMVQCVWYFMSVTCKITVNVWCIVVLHDTFSDVFRMHWLSLKIRHSGA